MRCWAAHRREQQRFSWDATARKEPEQTGHVRVSKCPTVVGRPLLAQGREQNFATRLRYRVKFSPHVGQVLVTAAVLSFGGVMVCLLIRDGAYAVPGAL